jgi:hypothetical protein
MSMDGRQMPQEIKDVLAEADEAVGAFVSDDLPSIEPSATGFVRPVPDLGPGGSLPISDLAQRLKLLSDAWVEIYEDGPLRIRFDIEGRRAHVQKTQGTPGNDMPQW